VGRLGRSVAVVGAVLALGAPSALGAAGSWQQVGGDAAHDQALSQRSAINADNLHLFAPAWTFPLGSAPSQPVAAASIP
jgi:glucose dehydrogenase